MPVKTVVVQQPRVERVSPTSSQAVHQANPDHEVTMRHYFPARFEELPRIFVRDMWVRARPRVSELMLEAELVTPCGGI
jgi:hypothetical protein